jgi:hypothetical protein
LFFIFSISKVTNARCRIQKRNAHADATTSEKSALRLPGAEKLLLAVPPHPCFSDRNSTASPGAEKKLRAYETAKYFVSQGSNGKREFIAYESEDDDEANRPVM